MFEVLKLLPCWVSLLYLTHSFNIDYEYTVLKNGPANSLFGFAVAEHKDDKKNSWILIGAPKSNSFFTNYAQTPGAVFKCDPNDANPSCKEVQFDFVGKSEYTSSDNQFFGVTLKSGGGNDKHIVACANRAKYFGSTKAFTLHEGSCFVLYDDFSNNLDVRPCRRKNDGGGTATYDNYGQCLAGTAMDVPDEKNETFHFFGAPGSKTGLGAVFGYNSELDDQIQTSESIFVNSSNSYLGYAVSHGKFFDKNIITIVTSGPRFNSIGKVILLTKDLLTVRQQLPAKEDQVQIASGYGVSLCTIDTDANGFEELIVGAPFHSNDALLGNQGLVYVYGKTNGKDELKLIKTIDASSYGTDSGNGAYFGQAIANAGDLNLDGYDDLVIGAPHDNMGQGAVYVYQGSDTGMTKDPSQIIRAAKVESGLNNNIGLNGFGRSFGTGLDTDNNGYKDVLVGAFTSDQAVLLRSRPVINVEISIRFKPKELKVTKDCPVRGTMTTCFDMEFCYNFTEPSGKLYAKPSQTIAIKYTLVADPIKRPRVRFASGSFKQDLIQETSQQTQCMELKKLYLVFNDEGVVPEFPDVVFEIQYTLPYDDGELLKPPKTDTQVVNLDNYPILKETYKDGIPIHAHELDFELKFERECTACIPDLKIISQKNFTVGLGQETFTFFASIKNNGSDPAYSVGIGFNFSKGLSLENLVVNNEKSVICSNNICDAMHNKLSTGTELILKVTLNTKQFKPTSDPIFNISVFSANQEDANTLDDNMVSVTLEYKVEADIQVLQGSSTQQVVYSGKAVGETAMRSLGDIGDIVDHKYIIRNNGPDLLPTAELTISWPVETKEGKHLLYLVDVIKADPSTHCVVPFKNILNLKGSNVGAFSAKYQAKVSENVQSQSRTRRAVTNSTDPVTTAMPSQQTTTMDTSKTNSSDVTTTPSTNGKTPGKKDRKKEGTVLDCSNTRCIDIICKFYDISNGGAETITIKSRLWQASLVIDYYGDVLTVVSNAKVDSGTNFTYIVDPNPKNNEIELDDSLLYQQPGVTLLSHSVPQAAVLFTNITPDFPPKQKERKLWVYVIAALAGVLLLVLLVLGLYKLGFFKRKRYDSKYAPKPTAEKKKLVKS